MGIFDFVKDAGEALFGDDEPENMSIDQAEVDAIRKGKIEQRLADLAVEVDGLEVSVDGNNCTLNKSTFHLFRGLNFKMNCKCKNIGEQCNKII